MTNLSKLKRLGACLGFILPATTFCRTASAETTLIDKDGWRFSFDGRVAAFLSVGQGDDFPRPSADPLTPGVAPTHTVMGGDKVYGAPDVGWKSSEAADTSNKYLAMRVRSGMIGNVLGFGLSRNLTDTTFVKGYVSIWSTVETEGRDKFAPVVPEAREGYFNVTGPWGSATVGRTFGWFGRMSTEIDYKYGHPYGVGLPCTDEVGPACGHIGTGVAFPGYSAGFAYSTPVLGGLQVHAGLYDPIVLAPEWQRAPLVRPEGAVTFQTKLGGAGLLKVGVEGLFQPLARVDTTADPVTGAEVKTNQKTSVWGASGGARLEIGPVRLGVSAFRGRGIGIGNVLQKSTVSVSSTSREVRTFTGVYGQGALVFGKLQVGAGAGVASADQLTSDRLNPAVSVIHQQIGVSASLYYHATESVVLGLDYFRFMARWYGAPRADYSLLPGEKQDLNFVNAGVTYHW